VIFAGAALCAGTAGHAQSTGTTVPIDRYIHESWSKLQRSMTECASLVDPKTHTAPVLYLPLGLAEPPTVRALHATCGVEIEHLPKKITSPGELMPSAIPTPGSTCPTRTWFPVGASTSSTAGTAISSCSG
jgi:alpha,alpha-trehalase